MRWIIALVAVVAIGGGAWMVGSRADANATPDVKPQLTADGSSAATCPMGAKAKADCPMGTKADCDSCPAEAKTDCDSCPMAAQAKADCDSCPMEAQAQAKADCPDCPECPAQ